MDETQNVNKPSGWLPLLVGALVVLVGLAFIVGGFWLIAVGGSWYYGIAGLTLLAAGVLLMQRKRSGAYVFGVVLLASFIWSAWESGLDYWRWVPRFDVILILAILVALCLPRLRNPFNKGTAYGFFGAGVAGFLVAFGLAFVPHGVTHAVAGLASPSTAGFQTNIQSPQQASLSGDQIADGDWPSYGRGGDALRYSPLTQINKDNVASLTKAWTFRTGDLPSERWGAETTPLKVGNQLYLCSSRNIMMSLDANSGEEIWRYDPKVDDTTIPYTAACRGVTYLDVSQLPNSTDSNDETVLTEVANATIQGTQTSATKLEVETFAEDTVITADSFCQQRIIEGTLDSRIIAVDAATGKPCTDFGDNGEVDITQGMGVPDGQSYMVAINSAPVIVNGVIITGHQVTDGQYRWGPSGVIQGFDAVTGELKWAWDVGAPERSGAPAAGETYTKGPPNMWTSATGDEQLGLVYLPMGNSSADYWSSSRRDFETPYTTALVALNVKTGKPEWKFQTVHMDVWDYDLGSQVSLIDYPDKNGHSVPAVVLPSKQGDIYILDRRTGKPLTGVANLPAPPGGVEPQMRAATQPHSLYHTLRKPDLTERDMWGITPFDQMYCRINFKRASYKGFYTPPTSETHWIEYPGYNGGSDWGSVAIDPNRGIMVANYNDMPNYNQLVPRDEANKLGWLPRDQQTQSDGNTAEGAGDPQEGVPYAIDVNAGWRVKLTGMLCKEPPYGGIRAIELASGRTLWDRPIGTARKNGPFGISSHLPINIGTPNNGGSVISASGLIFIAAATDDLIRAIDINTGETVWQDTLPAGGQATPMIYQQDGKEYLVIVAAGHHFMETKEGDYVIAYALPGNKA
ncbi:membrane-bound PQQ-dependent dehydrogenase, glucose/quinate/shikimate family [Halioxenophilus aromaticivorans]|uniref:Membrane-bound PQQ-dependent dehydrogenase, glucose/quinate/shikimate family n=1 Tax=Halioxenophilus aromaticivorans TaxID=1306992 RepID=A0AAV3U570_9ALTE